MPYESGQRILIRTTFFFSCESHSSSRVTPCVVAYRVSKHILLVVASVMTVAYAMGISRVYSAEVRNQVSFVCIRAVSFVSPRLMKVVS